VTDEPDLVSLPELTALRDLVSLPDLDVMPDLAALLGGSVLDRIGSGRHAAGRAAEPTDADETRSPADQAASPGVTGFARGEDSAASEGSAAAGQQRVRPKQPYGRITVYRVLEQYVAAFDQLLGDVVDGVRAYEPDTLVYAVNKVPSVPLLRILFAVFRDKAAYRKHTESPYFRELNCAGRPLLEATNVIELGSRRDSSTLDSSAFS
jgi:quinol monooxygenase YgiN